jgi:hypothetical protein
MIMESKYRRQALAAWKKAREASSDEKTASSELANKKGQNPIEAILVTIMSWFALHWI